MKKVMVTGGAGFIGSHFVKRMTLQYKKWQFVTVDSLTYAGNIDNLASLDNAKNHEFVYGDVTDSAQMAMLFKRISPDYVVHFAAETHVDKSIDNPDVFVRTNVLGTHCLLETAKKNWQIGHIEDGYPTYREGVRFIQISTDEVYGQILEGKADERAPLLPNSPYASSKAAADLVVRAYIKTYHFPAIITRSTNNFGPHQYQEKLIPLMIGRALKDLPLPVYGQGLQKRDWVYVDDHCSALETVLLQGSLGEIYNIGANNERTNMQIVRMILSALGKPESLISHTADRLAHDQRYSIDTAKIRSLGWQPRKDFAQALLETIDWYSISFDKQK